jgi:inner membrane protein
MPTIFTHGAIGFTAIKSAFGAPSDHRLMLASILLPILPDADALFTPWIPYGHPFGHRGFTHSLFFAALVGLVTAALAVRFRWTSDHSFHRYLYPLKPRIKLRSQFENEEIN